MLANVDHKARVVQEEIFGPVLVAIPYDDLDDLVAMANDTVATGSQWFVCLVDLDQGLRAVGVYTIFGSVVNGTNVIDEIAAVPVSDPEIGVPLEQVTIERIAISSGTAPTPSGE